MHATAATIPWFYLPQFRPARLQDCVLWLEADSFNGGIWRNLAPNSSDINHGTASGGVGLFTWHPQFPPTPLFDGVDDYVYCGNDESLRPSDAITLEAWIKPLSSGYEIINYRINGAGPYYVYQIRKSGAAITLYDGSDDGLGYTIPYTLSENSYHHSVLVFSKAEREFKYYVDGILRGLKTTEDYPLYTHCTPNHPDCSIFGFFIGCARNGTRHFPGIIDEVRIYNRALTPTEIRHNYTHHPLYYLQRGIDPYEVLTAATAAAAPSI